MLPLHIIIIIMGHRAVVLSGVALPIHLNSIPMKDQHILQVEELHEQQMEAPTTIKCSAAQKY